MTAVLALVASTSLLVVVAFDRPFTGSIRAAAEPLEAVLDAFGEGPGSGSVIR
jgi:hypothetical protein